jgi:hypothetical protein
LPLAAAAELHPLGNMTGYLIAGLIVLSVFALLGLAAAFFQDVIEKAIWPKGVTRLDDRGSEISVSDPKHLPEEQFPRSLYNKFFFDWIRGHKPRVPPAFVLTSSVFVIAPLFCLAIWYFGITVPQLVSWPISIGCLVLSVFAVRHLRQFILLWQSDAVVSFGHCPSCGYGLRQLQPDTDGRVTCPECGAAWRRRWLDSHIA